MSMLVLLGLTGDAPRNGDACRIATDIAIEEANKRADFLSGYHVTPVYRNEGPGSIFMAQAVVETQRQMSAAENAFLAPVFIGPWFSTGCKAAGPAISHLNMTHSAVGCTAQQMTDNRKLYPNLYRSRSPSEVLIFSFLRFIKSTGKWQRFGIVSDIAAAYGLSNWLLNEALANGFDVPYFEIFTDFDPQALQSLKDKDLRIIVVYLISRPLIAKFLCSAYDLGITGSRYVFIPIYVNLFDPKNYVDDSNSSCNSAILVEQFKSTYWVGSTSHNVENMSLRTTLGYNMEEFESSFDRAWRKITNGTRKDRPADYDQRTFCHDAALAGLVALNEAEARLKLRNLTLADYKIHGKIVNQVANESFANISYIGLRIGHFQFSSRLELDDDLFVAVKFEEGEVNFLYSMRKANPDDPLILASFKIRNLTDFNWGTDDGLPPKDQRIQVTNHVTVSHGSFLAIICASAVLSMLQLAILAYRLKLEKRVSLVFAATMTGCFLFNVTAIAISIPVNSSSGSYVYFIQTVTPACSAAIFQGTLFGQLLYCHLRYQAQLKRRIRQRRKKARKGKELGSKTKPTTAMQTLFIDERVKNHFTCKTTFAMVSATAVYLMTWLLAEPAPLKIVHKIGSFIDEEMDTLYTVKMTYYQSRHHNFWPWPLVVSNGLILLAGSYFSYELRKPVLDMEFAIIRMAEANLTTLFGASVLVYVTLSGDHVQRTMVLSVLALVTSVATSGIFAWRTQQNTSQRNQVLPGRR